MEHKGIKCMNCIHCDLWRMICTLESNDAMPKSLFWYDLFEEKSCDFFSKREGVN